MSSNQYQKKLTSYFNFKEGNQTIFSVELLKKSKELILDTNKYLDYSSYYNNLTMVHSFKLPNISDYPIRTNESIIPIKEYNKMVFYNKNHFNSHRTIVKREKKIKEEKSKLQNELSDNTINLKSFLIYIDKFNNMNGVIHKYITYKENYFVNKHKDGNKKLLLQYVNKHYYNDNLLPFDDNPIFKKENVFMIKDIEVKLRCDPLILIFFDENGQKNSKIKFPFNCIPFFYGLNFDTFKLFFFSVIDYNYKKNIFKLNQDKFNEQFDSILNKNNLYDTDCFLLNYNNIPHFKYEWIINKDNLIKKYKLKIKMPKIKVRFKYKNGHKTTLIKSLDSTHMSYLILEKFKDWDLFLLNSFCIIKEFRNTINSVLSYNPNLNNKNMKIDLDDTKIKLNKKSYSKFSTVFFITLYDDLGGKNYFFEIKTPQILINYQSDIIKNYEKIYELNMKEAIQLNKMRKSFWPEDMINRCLIVEEKNMYNKKWVETKLELDNKILDFDNDLLRFIKRQESFSNEIINNKSILKIIILFPKIIWFDSHNLIQKIYNMKRTEFEELFEMSMNDWYQYIIKNFQEIKKESNKQMRSHNPTKKNSFMISNYHKMRNKTRRKSLRYSVMTVPDTYQEKINEDNEC